MPTVLDTPRKKTLHNAPRAGLERAHVRGMAEQLTDRLADGGLVNGVRVQSLTDCDIQAVAAGIDCSSLQERMTYYGSTVAEHLTVQRERVLAGKDVLFALSDDDGFIGVCGVLAYTEGVEACVYLHDRAQGHGMLGMAAAVVRCAAEALGHSEIWVSIAADNDRSLQAVAKRLPPGTRLEARQESEDERHGAARDAYVALIDTAVGLMGGPEFSDSELSLIRSLAFRQRRQAAEHEARPRRSQPRGGLARRRIRA